MRTNGLAWEAAIKMPCNVSSGVMNESMKKRLVVGVTLYCPPSDARSDGLKRNKAQKKPTGENKTCAGQAVGDQHQRKVKWPRHASKSAASVIWYILPEQKRTPVCHRFEPNPPHQMIPTRQIRKNVLRPTNSSRLARTRPRNFGDVVCGSAVSTNHG
jgi:hypothetical protein